MATSSVDTRRHGKFSPWAILSPGGLWLTLFFLVPLVSLVRMALSEMPNRFAQPEFTGSTQSFSTAFSEYGSQFGRSFHILRVNELAVRKRNLDLPRLTLFRCLFGF